MKRNLIPALLAVFALCLVEGGVQWNNHAWTASYGSYPDEPSHFLSALLVRDYVVDGHGNPLEFARNYYTFQPYFAIGYWPPLFYVIASTWMLLFGYSRISTMIFTGTIAVAVAFLLYEIARRSVQRDAGGARAMVWGGSMAVLFLLIPSVRWSSSLFMVDLAVALFVLIATLFMGRFFEEPTPGRALVAGVLASAALLTKYSSAFVLLPPVLLVIFDRRWKLLQRPAAWIMPATVAILCGPWLYWSRRFTVIGVESFQREVFWTRLRSAYESLHADFGSVFGACMLLVLIGAWWHWKKLTITQRLLAMQLPCVVGFLFVAPVTIEQRYLLTTYPAMLMLLPRMFYQYCGKVPRLVRWAPLALAGAVVGYGAGHSSNFAPLQTELPRQIAREMIGLQEGKDSAILIATPAEGSVIAEVASEERARPGLLLVRSSKLLARMNWLVTNYEAREPNVEAVREIFKSYPIDTVLLCRRPGTDELPHDAQVRTMLMEDARTWSRKGAYVDADGSRYELYHRSRGSAGPEESLLKFIRERLPRVQ